MLIFVTSLDGGSFVGLLSSFHSSIHLLSKLSYGSGVIRRHQMYLSEIISQVEQVVVDMTFNPLIDKSDHDVFNNSRDLTSTITVSTDLTAKVKTEEIRTRLNTSTESYTNVPQIGGNVASDGLNQTINDKTCFQFLTKTDMLVRTSSKTSQT